MSINTRIAWYIQLTKDPSKPHFASPTQPRSLPGTPTTQTGSKLPASLNQSDTTHRPLILFTRTLDGKVDLRKYINDLYRESLESLIEFSNILIALPDKKALRSQGAAAFNPHIEIAKQSKDPNVKYFIEKGMKLIKPRLFQVRESLIREVLKLLKSSPKNPARIPEIDEPGNELEI